MHVSVWENAVNDNNNKFTLNFDFFKSQTDICWNDEKRIVIDKIIDLDLTKITYEAIRDILPFI